MGRVVDPVSTCRTDIVTFAFDWMKMSEIAASGGHPIDIFCLPRSTVRRHGHLTQSLRFTVRHLRWVPHFLTEEQKHIRVQMAIELLQVLPVQSTRQGHDIVALDESWIYLFSEHDLMWTVPGEIVVDRERHTVQSPKFMLTVMWNPIRFHVSENPPEGAQIQCTI
jgi:hypothetical protein